MGSSVELGEELTAGIEQHLEAGETHEEFVEELLNHYEAEGDLLWEGYGGAP